MRKTIKYILILFNCLQVISVMANTFPVEKTKESIMIDGILDEAVWKNSVVLKDFQMNYPYDSLQAVTKTDVRLTYDDKYLYLGVTCHNEMDKDYVVQSLKRDYDFYENDGFAVFIDAFNDATNGIMFGVNPYGVQLEGLVANGGTKGITTSWDGLWFVEVNRTRGMWVAEIAIPFKTLRYNGDIDTWRINFARNDLKRNEISTWIPIPRGFEVSTLAFMGQMLWDRAPNKQGTNVVLLPYAAGTISKDHTNEEALTTYEPNIGLDAKVALTSSLNLDLTFNPDFSQVEVDEQVLNLTRFELSFPERRLFFTENSDLFAKIGNSRVRPFFSRRIGGVGTTPVPVLFGTRLSGKLNRDWRIGVMSVQTEGVRDVAKSQNYTVATVQRRVLSGSTVKVFATNRQAFIGTKFDKDDYNRVGGLEFDHRSVDTKFKAHGYFHASTTKEKLKDNLAYGAKVRYQDTRLNIFFGVDKVGENYITDMGFVPRLYHENENGEDVRIPYLQWRSNGNYWFFQGNSDIIDYVGPEYRLDIFTQDLDYIEHAAELSFVTRFMNQSEAKITAQESTLNLFFPFTLSGLNTAFDAGRYKNQRFYSLSYDTGKRSRLYGNFEIGVGDEFSGKRFSFESQLSYRYKSWGVFSLTFERENLSGFSEEFGNPSFTLLGSKFEISFNKNIFWTTFLQYNTQKSNFNLNSRFQWRFRPMSDLYIVYTNNRDTNEFDLKDRALVVKLNYWINL